MRTTPLAALVASALLLLPLGALARQGEPAQAQPNQTQPTQAQPAQAQAQQEALRRQIEQAHTQAEAARAQMEAVQVQAQAERVKTEAAQVAKPPESWPGNEDKLADVTFKGGTVGEYIEALRKVYGPINLVIGPGVNELQMPAVTLYQVPKSEAINALLAVGSKHSFPGLKFNREKAFLSIVCTDWPAIQVPEPESKLETHVWPLEGTLKDGVKIEDMLSSLQTLLDLSNEKAEIKFHKETGVLMFRGTPLAVGEVNDLLNSVSTVQRQRFFGLEKSKTDVLTEQVKELSAQIEQVKAQRSQPVNAQPTSPTPAR